MEKYCYLQKEEFQEERRELVEQVEHQEHGTEILEEQLKENEQQLSEITLSLQQREAELLKMQEKLVSTASMHVAGHAQPCTFNFVVT